MRQYPVYTIVSPGFSVLLFETIDGVAHFLAREKMALKPDSFHHASETAIHDLIASSSRRVTVFYAVNSPDFAYRCERHDVSID